MQRTIEIRDEAMYYQNKCLGELVPNIARLFRLVKSGKYSVTITECERALFAFRPDENSEPYYDLLDDGSYMGIVCMKEFDKLFFVPDQNKRYNITVKEVK